MQINQHCETSTTPNPKDRISDSTANTEHQVCSKDFSCFIRFEGLAKFEFQQTEQLLSPKEELPQISNKLNKAAINYLMTVCWVRNFSDQILYLSIFLYYSYKAHKEIQKNNLEVLLITCVYLASKSAKSLHIPVEMLEQLIEGKCTKEDIVKKEVEVLEIVNFCILFDSPISYFSRKNLKTEQLHEVKLLSEILMLEESCIFYELMSLQNLVTLIEWPEHNCAERTALKKLLENEKNRKYLQILVNKYSSKFEVKQFLQNYTDKDF